MKKLSRLVGEAKEEIIYFLRAKGPCKRPKLEAYIISSINLENTRNGIEHRTRPVHRLAFILAFKELESQAEIEIQRPLTVPFPMTDNETMFSLNGDKAQ
jgi:hypothetical protein